VWIGASEAGLAIWAHSWLVDDVGGIGAGAWVAWCFAQTSAYFFAEFFSR
jgi:hypothetical protein